MKHIVILSILLTLSLTHAFAKEKNHELLLGNFSKNTIYFQFENKSCNFSTSWIEVPSLEIKKFTLENVSDDCLYDVWYSYIKKSESFKGMIVSSMSLRNDCESYIFEYGESSRGSSCQKFKPT